VKDARRLAQQVKSLLPKVTAVLGGPHTKLAWRELLTEPWFDVILVGEGEQVFPVICHRLMASESIEELLGVVTRRNANEDFQLNHSLLPAADLNSLPFPEYDLFPKNVRESLRTNYPLVTARGCVYNCTYCSVPEISGKRFRKRHPKSVIEELKWAQKKYGTAHFEIIDDVFNLDIGRCKEICRSLIEANLGMGWSCPNGLRADRVDRELAEVMLKAGCRNVMIGVESADPDILKAVKKGECIEDIERGICIFKQAGIHVGGYFIIGLPGDSFKVQQRSVEFVKRTGIGAHFNMLVPYRGTQLWDWAKTNARFLCNPEDGLHFADDPDKVKIVIETDDFPASQRQQAYEMVHTQLGRFDMLIPPGLPQWQHRYRMLRLLWKYDRAQLPSYIFRQLSGKFRRMLGQLIRPAGKLMPTGRL